ncbi:hypothetical protein Dimus_003049 [Dionaea muscipula]
MVSFAYVLINLLVGAAIVSNNMFLFGQMDIQIKLIPRYSAGTVVAFSVTTTLLEEEQHTIYPDGQVISLGIGDTTEPIPEVTAAMAENLFSNRR